MKRQLDLHRNVVGLFCPTTLDALTVSDGRAPRGQVRAYDARSQVWRDPAADARPSCSMSASRSTLSQCWTILPFATR